LGSFLPGQVLQRTSAASHGERSEGE
jgi:hypothetical protein